MHKASVQGPKPRLLIAGATGVLGHEVLRELAGSDAYSSTQVLAREPMRAGMRYVETVLVPNDEPAQWPPGAADTAIVLFDPPRLFFDRERALWTPLPAQLPDLAQWLHASGVRTIAVVMPHDPGRLPEALKRGLASVDEHAVARLGFERVLILRTASKPGQGAATNILTRLAQFMLSTFKYMVPSTEQPVRAPKVAQLLAVALRIAPRGIHVAAPETVWRAAQAGRLTLEAKAWLRPQAESV
jgi:hypothetical protein